MADHDRLADIDVTLESATSKFRCRKCGIYLFSSNHIQPHTSFKGKPNVKSDHYDQAQGQVHSSSRFCTSWFLRDENKLPWVHESVEESSWTKGKIYCPKCRSRIGAFNYIQGVQCDCGKFTIPSIWIQKSRVDHIFLKDSSINHVSMSEQTVESSDLYRRKVRIKHREGSLSANRCERTRNACQQIRSLAAGEVKRCLKTKPLLIDEDKNAFRCLPVDEGMDETIKRKHKVDNPEIQDHHCCAICLDLLFEPFKCSCDHVFCDPCLRQLNFRTGRSGTIRCPLCRQTVEHLLPASELRKEIRNTYGTKTLRKRERAERHTAFRKWPLPASHGPPRSSTSGTQRSVTHSCLLATFVVSSLVVILLLRMIYYH
ncbi:uncharacterized protein [Montipora foliosa]|uniref:uncharacterized protein isoform X4 n=1 Tax=Montipora foliosa TaxID=591990 RepID=UPI0035F1DE0C